MKYHPTDEEKKEYYCARFILEDGGCCKSCPNYDKTYACINSANRWKKHLCRKYAIKYLFDRGADVVDMGNGFLHVTSVNAKSKVFVFVPFTGKWRVNGRAKWYRSCGVESFYLAVKEDL